jgi:proteasome lid subunit RPN8/RPN11
MIDMNTQTQSDRACFIAASVIDAIDAAIAPARRRRVEGIAYLLGRTDGLQTCLLACVPVEARCTRGSFFVSAKEMVRVVNTANDLGLQVAGQIHTHPSEAFHSDGDEDGARIRFDGFVSIVLPDYGIHLPQLSDAVAFMFSARDGEFVQIPFGQPSVVSANL